MQIGHQTIFNHKKFYTMQIISQYDVTIGVVTHLLDFDIKNEFDPLMVERLKNCMKQLIEKNFI